MNDADVAPLMRIYAATRTTSDFGHGVEAAIEGILVSPQFLFVMERDPRDSAPGSVHPVSDIELATRISLFLWSSIPDETLLQVAEAGRLHEPAVMSAQVDRMLADPRARALTTNFAGQWLYLRNLDQQRPDITVFPTFDARLRSAMASETEMFFASVVRDDRSVLDFISADYTFLNQRLAEHYGIPGITGTAFRKVSLDPSWNRGGLLGQASILTVTSYGNHTSVVKRGKWILDNMLAAPPPPPPPDVPALKTELDGRQLTAREQLEMHRKDPSCAACHKRMDPLGFALETFDAVGAHRQLDAGQQIDVSAVMPDGSTFSGFQGLQQILMARKDEFTGAFTERLMTYALSRGLQPPDMPAVRAFRATRRQTIITSAPLSRASSGATPSRCARLPQNEGATMRLMRKSLNRRTVLRGLGATMALPFLEAMMPSAKAADIAERPKRFQVFYSPNGMMMPDFVPSAPGTDLVLSPTLEPLASFRGDIAVVTGLGHPQAAAMGDRPAGHGRSLPGLPHRGPCQADRGL